MSKIGLIQVNYSVAPDVKTRQDALIKSARECFDVGAELVFFPECYQYAAKSEKPKDLANEYGEQWKERCSELAKEYGTYLVPWDYRTDNDGKTYNTSYILDRDGNEIGRYRKCNLTHGELKNGLTCGDNIPVFDLDIGKIGIMICFDNYFPEVAATLGNKGAQMILYPLYGDTLNPQWEIKTRARAIDHSVYVLSSQISNTDFAFTGIIDPEGNIVKKLVQSDSYCVEDLDIGRAVHTNLAAARDSKGENLREFLHKNRNPKAFKDLSDVGTEPLDWDEIYY